MTITRRSFRMFPTGFVLLLPIGMLFGLAYYVTQNLLISAVITIAVSYTVARKHHQVVNAPYSSLDGHPSTDPYYIPRDSVTGTGIVLAVAMSFFRLLDWKILLLIGAGAAGCYFLLDWQLPRAIVASFCVLNLLPMYREFVGYKKKNKWHGGSCERSC